MGRSAISAWLISHLNSISRQDVDANKMRVML